MNKLKRRVIEISYDHQLSHIGSCITALPIIKEIYDTKRTDDPFILSAGHAHLAHLVVMEHFGIIKNAEDHLHDIHCNREAGCDVSTGSLGQGLPIAVGMAMSDRERDVYCLISDGECSEGSIYEALRIAGEQELTNLHIHCNYNEWAAYKQTDLRTILRLSHFFPITIHYQEFDLPFLEGQEAHYMKLNDTHYKQAKDMYER